MIKAIIFDLTDVCFSAEEPPFIRDFAKRHDIPFKEFEEEYLKLLFKAENHEISGKKLWQILLHKYKIRQSPERLIKEMIDGKEAKKRTLLLAKSLREGGYRTAFFTNYNEDYWKLVAKKFDLTKYFDFGLVSYQIGARKPSPKGFRFIMKKLKAKPSETVFIDDSTKNLAAAEKLGIKTIQFKGFARLKKELQKSGVVH